MHRADRAERVGPIGTAEPWLLETMDRMAGTGLEIFPLVYKFRRVADSAMCMVTPDGLGYVTFCHPLSTFACNVLAVERIRCGTRIPYFRIETEMCTGAAHSQRHMRKEQLSGWTFWAEWLHMQAQDPYEALLLGTSGAGRGASVAQHGGARPESGARAFPRRAPDLHHRCSWGAVQTPKLPLGLHTGRYRVHAYQ